MLFYAKYLSPHNHIRRLSIRPSIRVFFLSLMRELLASIACNDLLHPIRLVNKMREESLSFKSVPLALSQLSPLSSATKSGQGCFVGVSDSALQL